ncbi:YtzI protein [Solibacillus sp. FSL H8-0538]
MTIPLNVLIVICIIIVAIITAMTLIAVKWGYSVKHTIDPIEEHSPKEKQ